MSKESSLTQEKKKGRLLLVICFILVMILCGGLGYYLGTSGLIGSKEVKEDNTTKKEDKKTEIKDGSLDVESEIVKSLYEKVGPGVGTHPSNMNWRYDNNGEFDYATATAEDKMKLVAMIVDESNRKVVSCEGLTIPEKQGEYYYSVCAFNANYGSNGEENYYEASYLESVYKDIFGKSANFENGAMRDKNTIDKYYYVAGTNNYYKYTLVSGAEGSPVKFEVKLDKAEKANDEIKIYESVERFEEEVSKGTTSYVYTFKKDSDTYGFVSRKVA